MPKNSFVQEIELEKEKLQDQNIKLKKLESDILCNIEEITNVSCSYQKVHYLSKEPQNNQQVINLQLKEEILGLQGEKLKEEKNKLRIDIYKTECRIAKLTQLEKLENEKKSSKKQCLVM